MYFAFPSPHLRSPPGLVLEPLPVGAWATLSVTTALATGMLTFRAAFYAFTNDVIWLIVVSFFFARVRLTPGGMARWFERGEGGRAPGQAADAGGRWPLLRQALLRDQGAAAAWGLI